MIKCSMTILVPVTLSNVKPLNVCVSMRWKSLSSISLAYVSRMRPCSSGLVPVIGRPNMISKLSVRRLGKKSFDTATAAGAANEEKHAV
jgi:hypothetical protein